MPSEEPVEENIAVRRDKDLGCEEACVAGKLLFIPPLKAFEQLAAAVYFRPTTKCSYPSRSLA